VLSDLAHGAHECVQSGCVQEGGVEIDDELWGGPVLGCGVTEVGDAEGIQVTLEVQQDGFVVEVRAIDVQNCHFSSSLSSSLGR
jgi:hypothetical protein